MHFPGKGLAALLVVFFGVAGGLAMAQTPAPFQINASDLVQLLRAARAELTPNSGAVIIQSKSPGELPAFDPVVHYAGLGVDPKHPNAPVIWFASGQPTGDAATQAALEGAMMLAVMDSGEAGPKWKEFYDLAARADAALPPSVQDRYQNRHRLMDAVRLEQSKQHAS